MTDYKKNWDELSDSEKSSFVQKMQDDFVAFVRSKGYTEEDTSNERGCLFEVLQQEFVIKNPKYSPLIQMYAKGGTLGSLKPKFLLFNDGKYATIRIFHEKKGSDDYEPVGDMVFFTRENKEYGDWLFLKFEVSYNGFNTYHLFLLMAKIVKYIYDKVPYEKRDNPNEIMSALGGEEIISPVGFPSLVPKAWVGQNIYEVLDKEGRLYTSVVAPNLGEARKRMARKMKGHRDLYAYTLQNTGKTIQDSRSAVTFGRGGNLNGFNYSIGGL